MKEATSQWQANNFHVRLTGTNRPLAPVFAPGQEAMAAPSGKAKHEKSGRDIDTSKIDLEGWVNKKAASGPLGMRPWQKKWCCVNVTGFCYSKKEKDPDPKVIGVRAIQSCELLPDKRLGGRFDLLLVSGHVYSFDAATGAEAKRWKRHIDACVKAWRIKLARQEMEVISVPLSVLQSMFFSRVCSFYNWDRKCGRLDRQKWTGRLVASQEELAGTNFGTDAAIQEFLLHFLIHPAYAIAHYFPLFDNFDEYLSRAGKLVIPRNEEYVVVREMENFLDNYRPQNFDLNDLEPSAVPMVVETLSQFPDDFTRAQASRRMGMDADDTLAEIERNETMELSPRAGGMDADGAAEAEAEQIEHQRLEELRIREALELQEQQLREQSLLQQQQQQGITEEQERLKKEREEYEAKLERDAERREEELRLQRRPTEPEQVEAKEAQQYAEALAVRTPIEVRAARVEEEMAKFSSETCTITVTGVQAQHMATHAPTLAFLLGERAKPGTHTLPVFDLDSWVSLTPKKELAMFCSLCGRPDVPEGQLEATTRGILLCSAQVDQAGRSALLRYLCSSACSEKTRRACTFLLDLDMHREKITQWDVRDALAQSDSEDIERANNLMLGKLETSQNTEKFRKMGDKLMARFEENIKQLVAEDNDDGNTVLVRSQFVERLGNLFTKLTDTKPQLGAFLLEKQNFEHYTEALWRRYAGLASAEEFQDTLNNYHQKVIMKPILAQVKQHFEEVYQFNVHGKRNFKVVAEGKVSLEQHRRKTEMERSAVEVKKWVKHDNVEKKQDKGRRAPMMASKFGALLASFEQQTQQQAMARDIDVRVREIRLNYKKRHADDGPPPPPPPPPPASSPAANEPVVANRRPNEIPLAEMLAHIDLFQKEFQAMLFPQGKDEDKVAGLTAVDSTSISTIRALTSSLLLSDVKAHELAVKVLWLYLRQLHKDEAKAGAQFANTTEIYARPKMSHPILDSFMNLLLREDRNLTSSHKLAITPFMPIRHPFAWPALLRCLRESDITVRSAALGDINALLYGNLDTVLSLIDTTTTFGEESETPEKATRREEPKEPVAKNWQLMAIALLSDFPKDRSHHDNVQQECFAQILNLFTSIHFMLLVSHELFLEQLLCSIHAVIGFAGHTDNSARVVTLLLYSLVTKITANTSSLPLADKNNLVFHHIAQLLGVIKKYVFETAYLNLKKNKTSQRPVPNSQKALQLSDPVHRQVAQMNERHKQSTREMLLPENKDDMREEAFWDRVTDDLDLGLHWDDASGTPLDGPLVEIVGLLVEWLDRQHPNLIPTDSLLSKSGNEKSPAFWKVSVELLSMINLEHFQDPDVLTYRKLGINFVKKFLAATTTKKLKKVVTKLQPLCEDLDIHDDQAEAGEDDGMDG